MKKIFFLLQLLCILSLAANAQHSVQFIIKNKINDSAVSNASIQHVTTKTGIISDSLGNALMNDLPQGKNTFIISSINYKEEKITLTLPLLNDGAVKITLEEIEEEEEEIIVKSTRSSRTIKNLPTRVETIDGEEVDEKNNMRPANVSMLLHESTGIQVQQTSATSANASIRIQGLDGRYTQILKDGLPNYSGFSGGLSILEIPPLDLQQVEVIKGPSSTLYGGGSIAGTVNFISVEPGKTNYSKFLVNQSNIGQTNVAAFIVQKINNFGFTFLATGNLQKAFDVDEDDFTELPKTKDFTISPKLFFYINEKSKLIIGHTFTAGSRDGGDIQVLQNKADAFHTYFEKNTTRRNSTHIEFEKKWNDKNTFTAKQSINFFTRNIEIPFYRFKGLQKNMYTDISNIFQIKKHTLITGANFIYDHFKEDKKFSGVERNDKNTTAGIYLQDTWDATDKISFENGIRVDFTKRYGSFFLPRLSMLYKINTNWSSRISAGMGYKLPTIFTEQTEALQYQNVAALNSSLKAEKSYGGTADINFKKRISTSLDFSLNQMFFYTSIHQPLILQSDFPNSFFINSAATTKSYGFETNMKIIFKESWKLFTGYTFTHTKAGWLTGNQFLPLLPKHKLNLALIYEKHDFLKVGLEAYRTGEQFLSNGNKTPAFWEFGFMVEKPLKNISLYINFENFTDQRQSNYKRVVNEPHNNPTFDEIWNHTEGFVINGGIKIKL